MDSDFFIKANKIISDSGLPNYVGARIKLPSPFNFEFLEKHLHDFKDKIVIQFLKYGFPLGHDGKTGSTLVPDNHVGATEFPVEMNRILKKELKVGSAIGPFEKSPFANARFSPLNSVPKKDSDQRRLILDLSFPQGNSINDGIDKDTYEGIQEKLVLLSIDDLTSRIMQLGAGCRIFKIDLSRGYHQFFIDPGQIHFLGYVYKGKKIDLSRGYHQFFIDPGQIHFLGYVYKGKFYFDTTLSLGS